MSESISGVKVCAVDNASTARPRTAAFRVAFRRSLLLTVVLALVGAAGGAAFGAQRAESYTASASILIEPLDGNPYSPTGSGDDLLNLETEAELLRSDAVATLVGEDTGTSKSPSEILQGLSVSVPPNTQILMLEYTSHQAGTAVNRAQSFADSYLEYRRTRAKDLVKNQTGRIDDRIAERNGELKELVQKLSTTRAGASSDLLQEKVDAVSTQINQLKARDTELQTGSLEPGQVVTPAAVPSSRMLHPAVIFGGIGLLGGLLIALCIVLMRSRGDSRLSHTEDVQTAGIPVLGVVGPDESAALTRAAPDTDDQPTQLPEAYKRLRVAFLTGEPRRPVSVLLASASTDAGSPASAVGLARSTALSNIETVLVDATVDPSGPTTQLEAGEQPGLSEILTGVKSVDEALVPISPNLQLLPRGVADIDADDLFIAPQMTELLDDLRKRVDIVFVVSTAVQLARVEALSSLVDTVVVEATEGVTSQRDLRRIVDDRDPAHGDDGDIAPGHVAGVIYVSRT